MSKWPEVRVKDLFGLGRGRVISGIEITANPGHYPVFSSQSSNQGRMGSIGTYDFEGEYVTWTTDGANAGTVFHRSGRFNCTNVCGTLKAKVEDEVSHKFMAYQLSRLTKRHVSYVGNPKLMNGVMGQIKLFHPPFPEQKAIANILDTLDTQIRQIEAIIAKLQQVKQGLLHDLLTRGVDANGQLRPPRDQAPELYKESPLGWIPKEWEYGPIDLFLERIIDYRGKTPVKTDVGVPLITAKNVRLGYIDPEPREYIAEDDYDQWMTRGIPKASDVLYTTEAPLGMTAQLGTDERLAFAQRLIILRPKDNLEPKLLMYRLLTEQFRKSAIERSSGSTALGIKQREFRKILTCFPKCSHEQRAIVEQLDAVDKQTKSSVEQLSKLGKQKSGLMDDLLTGRVRVTSLLDTAKAS